MKLYLVFTLFLTLTVSAAAYSQNDRVSLTLKAGNLSDALIRIKDMTGVQIIYNEDLLENLTCRKLTLNQVTAAEAIGEILKDSGFYCEKIDEVFVIKPAPQPQQQVAQPARLAGKVTDDKGQPLPGVTVMIKGTGMGTATDMNGSYSMNLPGNGKNIVLVYSFVGMEVKEVAYTGQAEINVVLEPAVEEMDEVVCTGYQTLNKVNTTGAFTTIKPETIEMRGSIGLDRLLEGSVPGLTVYKNDIRIRGGSSINAGTKPLYIVDGFEVDQLPENMDLVERITVLKDAAAAAIWGARASNGVIVIETKKGKKGEARIAYSGNFRVDSKFDYDDLRRADGKMIVDYDLEAFDKEFVYGAIYENSYGGYSPSYRLLFDYENGEIGREELLQKLDALGSRSNKEQIKDKLLRNAFTQRHNLSVYGGGDRLTYFLSGNYLGSHSGYQGDKDQAVNILSKNSYELIPQLTLRADLSITYDKKDNGYGDVGGSIEKMLPYHWLYEPETGAHINDYTDFNIVQNARLMELGYKDNGFNVLDEIDLANDKTNTMNVRTKFGLDVNILDGLKVSADYQYERTNQERKNIQDAESYSVRRHIINQFTTENNGVLIYNLPNGDVLDMTNVNGTTHTFKAGVSLNRTFGKNGEHYVNAIAGFDLRKHASQTIKNRKLGYNDELQSWQTFDQASMAKNGVQWLDGYRHYYDASNYDGFSYNENREVSGYGSLVYTYDRRYTLSGTFRIDKSNLFGADKKYRRNPLWSVGASWNVQEEDFFHSEVVNRLVPRITYGLTGNFDRSGSTTPLLVARRIFSNVFGGYYTRVQTPPNDKLRWERTKTLNIGVETELFNRLNLSVEYYDKHSYDLLGNVMLDPTLGFTGSRINAADMRNRGVEIMLNAGLVRTEPFQWNVNFVFGYNKNKITKNNISDGQPEINRPRGIIQFVEGYAREAIWSYRWAGLSEEGDPQTFDAEGNKVTKASLESLVCSGTYLPKYNGSLSTDFKYKNLTLMLSFVYNFGHVFRMEYPAMNPMESTDLSNLINKRWKNPGDEQVTDIPAMLTWEHYFDGRDRLAQYSSNSIRKGDFIRLREIMLNYDLPKEWLRTTPFQRVSLTAQANTLWMWTKNKEKIDPEFVDPVHGTLSLSEPASFTFGLKLEF
ncbi:MAG: SusC/RagA family TonB-linked outer membrane protein [Odoribacter sp.]|nr:SusC/RagA family TonB-linked outer membrane protein [Odoribacter sp.]